MIPKLFNKLNFSINKKNVMKISSGTILGQLISIFTLPIITRLYGAEIIGIWVLLNSISIIINSFSDLGLKNSIMVESKEDVEKSYKVISTISGIISIVLSIIITHFYYFFSDDVNINQILFFILLTIIVFTSQQIQICYTWLNRNGNYNVLMKNPLINNGVNGILGIVLGFFGLVTFGYFIAQIIGQVVTLLHMKRNLPNVMFTFRLQDFSYIIKKNKRFVLYQVPTNIIGKLKSQLPNFLIQTLWGTEMLGYFSITIKLLQVPSSLLASAIGRVFFQTTSSIKRQGKPIGYLVNRNMALALKFAIIPMALLIAFGDVVVVMFLGKEWTTAGNLVQVLGLYYYFVFVMSTVQGLEIVLEKQNYLIVSLISQMIVTATSFSLGKFIFNDIYIALLMMSSLNIIVFIIYFCILYKLMEISWLKFLKKTLVNILLMLGLSVVLKGIFIIPDIKNLFL